MTVLPGRLLASSAAKYLRLGVSRERERRCDSARWRQGGQERMAGGKGWEDGWRDGEMGRQGGRQGGREAGREREGGASSTC
eukprot:1822402-Rhodomonas_salina.1